MKVLLLLGLLCFKESKFENAPSVVIVGAGAAGMAAASKLVENNVTNLIILEAEDRIGGRIHSVEFGDAVVDLGAEWCHGKFTIIYKLIESYNLVVRPDMSNIYYYSTGELPDQKFTKELYKIFEGIYKGDMKDAGNTSIGEYLKAKYNQIINERYENNDKQLEFANEFLKVLNKIVLTAKGAFSWLDASAVSDYHVDKGNRALSWNGRGFKTLFDVLMKTYPNPDNRLPIREKIQFNKEVVKIKWENEITVECSDGSTFTADHVILTPSLGVLKERHHTLFHPRLPEEKLNAIKELGIGAVFKAFLHFPIQWWTSDQLKYAIFVWSEQDVSQILNTTGQAWLLDFYMLHPVEQNPNVLEAWFSGTTVPEIELFADSKIIDGIMFVCNKFLGHQFPNLTRPNQIIRYNWYNNRNFRGTYSYQTLESRKREISGEIILSQPLFIGNGTKSLLFAGEATSPIYYGTTHGAIETGFREANRIINLYN